VTASRTGQEPLPSSRQIRRTYYVIAGVYTLSASLIWGINTVFLLRVGALTLTEAFLANAVFTGSMALFEVPTGMVADARGRRRSFLYSVTVLLAGTLAYVAVPALGGGFGGFVAASIVLGLGYTFYSGAVEAWVVDTLAATGDETGMDRVLARGQFVSSAAMLVGSVAGGLLGSLDLSSPYLVRCGLLIIAFAVGYKGMHEPGFAHRELPMRNMLAEMGRIGRNSFEFGWRSTHARLAILAGAMPAIYLEWGYHAWQPYFLDLIGSGAVWILGWIAAAIAVASMLGNWLVERITQFCGKRTTLLLGASAVFSATAIGVGLTDSFAIALTLYLVGMTSAGVFQPVRQAYLHKVVPGEQRATVLSLASLVASGGSMGGQAGLGLVTRGGALSLGYVVGGVASALALPFVLRMRAVGGSADVILGRAGRYATCPTLALPQNVAVAAERDLEVEADRPLETPVS
jgi:MFS family permease